MSCFQSRGCPLLGIYGTPDLAAHEQRFLQNGWHTACARDMNAIYTKHIDPADRQRSASYLTHAIGALKSDLRQVIICCV